MTGKKSKLEKRGKTITLVCTAIMLFIVVAIIAMVIIKGSSTFADNHVSISKFLFSDNWKPSKGVDFVGALPMILGSFYVTIISTLVATPMALAASIFIVEIRPKLGKKIIQPIIEVLVGIPSVVYGLIGLFVIVPYVRNTFGGSGFGILAASVVLTVMVLPTITSLSVDAIASVDQSQKEGAMALGATRWQMIRKVVLKSAMPGILTAVILGMARAFGEALAVQMVIGNTTVIPKSLTTPASTLTSILTMSMGNTIPGTLQNNVLWSLALVLMIMSLVFISLTYVIGSRSKQTK